MRLHRKSIWCQRGTPIGMRAAARSKATQAMLTRSPSRQTASWSRRPLTTARYGYGRRRRGRVAARSKATRAILTHSPSRQTASIFRQTKEISLSTLLLHHHPRFKEPSPLASSYKTSGCVLISSGCYGFLLNTDRLALQFMKR